MMLVAKRQVIPERPGKGRERCSQPTRSSWDELDFFKEENTNIVLHTDIGQRKSNCGMMNLVISSQVLKENRRSL